MPTNITLAEGTPLEAAEEQLAAAGLRYPLLAKPLWADGREGSHALGVLGSRQGLRQLVQGQAPDGFGLPVLLQEYVDHGGETTGGAGWAGRGMGGGCTRALVACLSHPPTAVAVC